MDQHWIRLARAAALATLLLGTACDRGPRSDPGEVRHPPGDYIADISGSRIAYHVAGSGPIVFVHPGGPGLGWEYLRLPEVEKFATLVYMEPIGTGGSSRKPGPRGYSLNRYVSDLEGLRTHMNVKRMVILGHSHGGFVAQGYALAHPERLKGLILYGTTPTTGPAWQRDVEANLAWFAQEPWYPDAAEALAQETGAKTDEEITRIFRREFPLYFADWTARGGEFEEIRNRTMLFIDPIKATSSAGREFGAAPFEVVDRLGRIRVPTLVIAGKRDFVASERFGRVLHERIPGSRLLLLEKSGHMGHLEEPKEFADAVRSFLLSIESPSP